ncbi:class E sortase [Nocardioides sp. W3-2-3]|nr:class E sortase [Nocardioides convexus]
MRRSRRSGCPASGRSGAARSSRGPVWTSLARGVGHYLGTALPGQVGNFSVAGHRLTHGSAFTDIDRLRTGDVVGVRTAGSWFVYRVTAHEIVEPGALDVIAPVPDTPGATPSRALMTLTSCHPLYGSSQRYVVHAEPGAQPARRGRPAR